MSLALVVVCQECFGPVMVVEQLSWDELDMGWHRAREVCLRCDWWRWRDVAEVPRETIGA